MTHPLRQYHDSTTRIMDEMQTLGDLATREAYAHREALTNLVAAIDGHGSYSDAVRAARDLLDRPLAVRHMLLDSERALAESRRGA